MLDPDRILPVPRELAGTRSAELLEGWLTGVRRTAIRRLFRDGQVLLNGEPIDPWRRVRNGDVVVLADGVDIEALPRVHRAKSPEPAVLYEDATCLVVDKPAGLATVPPRQEEPSVHSCLTHWFPDDDLRIVHRLDKETSGCLILARGRNTAAAFDAMLREGSVEKVYLALVRGRVRRDELTCDAQIGMSMRGGRVRIGPGKGAREARTDFVVRERYRGYTLLEARPRTGRQHQIRAHLAQLGHPLVVDRLYGGGTGLELSQFKHGYRRRRTTPERPLVARLTLHALSLTFASPAGARVAVEAPLPKDLRVTLDKLARFAGERSREGDDA